MTSCSSAIPLVISGSLRRSRKCLGLTVPPLSRAQISTQRPERRGLPLLEAVEPRDGRLPGNRICRLADHLDHDVELAHGALPVASRIAPAEDFAGRSRRLEHLLADDPIFGSTLHINNPLKNNVISWRFRARLAILYNKLASSADCDISPLPAGDHGRSVRVSHAVQRRRRMVAQAVSFRRAGLFRGRTA